MPKCSIVIPVHNRASLTRQCLNALQANDLGCADFEVIVVDDASTDATQALLAGYGELVRTVTHTTNRGFAVACNEGAAAASGEYLVFLNNDTIPKRHWLGALVDYADAYPDAAVVGSKLIYPNETIQHAGVVVCQDHFPRHLYAGFPADHPATNKSRRFQIVTAGCALFRREPFEWAGGFDLSYMNSYEDVDLCLRLGERGHEIHYCHEAVLYHLESVSEGRLARDEQNCRLYRERWAHRVQPDDLQYYFEDGLLNIDYSQLYPFRLAISPHLAVVEGDQPAYRADQLLEKRSRQMYGLLKENIGLEVRLREAEFRVRDSGKAPEIGVVETPGNSIKEPQVLFTGKVHAPRIRPTGRLVSIIISTRDGASQLRESLPKIIGQRIGDGIEIIALDAGSKDDTVEVLRESNATVVSVDPACFDRGFARNLACTSYAKGHLHVFVNQRALPVDDLWLANLIEPLIHDQALAVVCSRVLPRRDAEVLELRDGASDPKSSPERTVRTSTDWVAHPKLPLEQLRMLGDFHMLSTAIRPQVLSRIPFQGLEVLGEDILWAKQVLEAGFGIRHEPSSGVFHSGESSLLGLLLHGVAEGIVSREVLDQHLGDDDVLAAVLSQIGDDWSYLDEQCNLTSTEVEHWRLVSAARRTAQVLGLWIGANRERVAGDLISLLSSTARVKVSGLGSSTKAQSK